ncbi:alanine/glycine:cation symporter family protein [Pseudonocardia sp. NPDC049635]|uniref:alanine/glycine:cation symporter family protein n=1 Tax=Pseudonocardia sp. NPDC049635 TaxID=3155506 RepID=UPI0033FBEACC
MTSAPLTPPPAPGQGPAADVRGVLSGVENALNEAFAPIAETVSAFVFAEIMLFGVTFPWIVAWLVLAGAIFTVYFGFVQFRNFPLAIALVRGRLTRDDEPGEITHFQALTSALSGTVGLGNIAGVGVAVTIGGPGATFWMIVAGLLGMCTKFVECTLGVKYREIHPDGSVSGGPMQYLRKGIAERIPGNVGKALGRTLAALAAVFILFFGIAAGNMFQANQTFAQLRSVTGGEAGIFGSDGAGLVFGVLLALVVGAVIFGGITSIGRVTSRLVPAMGIIYVIACLCVIVANLSQVPAAIAAIFSGAFTGAGVTGGAIGALIVGFQRASFSNEAGLGSAPIAHSAVKTKRPVTEGYVALLEPFIDTVIICTMTALTIVIASTPFWRDAQATVMAGGATPDGVLVTSDAFATVMPWFPYVLTVAVALFAISTIITWGYYGQKAWTYLFGMSRVSERLYQGLYSLFVIAGSVLTLSSVLDFADAVLFLLALFNIIGLYLLAPIVQREVRAYRDELRCGEVQLARLDPMRPPL